MNPLTTLREVHAFLRSHSKDGTECPACFQRVQMYRRPITSTMARSLIALYRAGGTTEFVHLPTVLDKKGADEGKLPYWGLLEEELVRRPDGGRAGYWRVTDRGRAFIFDGLRVPSHALVYNRRCYGLDDTTTVSIDDALGKKFNLAELLAGV